MIAIFKREIMNYLKRPLFWVGVLLVIYGVFNATSPYLTTHYLTTGEKIINDQSNTSVEGEVYEGYIPCLLYTSPSPRDRSVSRMPSSA